MTRACRRALAAVLIASLAWLAAAQAPQEPRALPEAVRETIESTFPGAQLRSIGLETEEGVRCYEVRLILNGKPLEVEVDQHGAVGEIERRISLDEAPEILAGPIRQIMADKGKVRIERHERWGVVRDGRFVPLDQPRLFYEVTFHLEGSLTSGTWNPPSVSLPESARKGIEAAFPRAVLTEVEIKSVHGMELRQVVLVRAGVDMRVTVSPGGSVVEVQRPVAVESLPPSARAALTQAVGDGRIARIWTRERRAEVREGRLVPLPDYRVTYPARLRRDDLTAEVEVAADGSLVTGPEWRKAAPDDKGKTEGGIEGEIEDEHEWDD